MRYDRDIYFDAVRQAPFPGSLTQEQVDGQNAILSVWEFQSRYRGGMTDQRCLAYMLATAFHETAARMWPIEEYGKGAGYTYGEPDPQTSQTYYGRGFVQLTWRENYATATKELELEAERDLEWHAEMALDTIIATKVMFMGMRDGWFTGRKLYDYFSDTVDDPVNARQVINGNNKDTLIAGYHDNFMAALTDAYQDEPKRFVLTLNLASGRPITLVVKPGKNVHFER